MDFIKEFQRLLFSEPTYALRSPNNTNCPYVHMISHSKSCYLCFASYKLEDSGYSFNSVELRDCWDIYFSIKCELCYECVACTSCYNCTYSEECLSCTDCEHCYDCRNCTNCFGCVGLRKKQFHIFNKPYSKEEYTVKIAAIKGGDSAARANINAEVFALRRNHPHVASVQMNAENCTGDHIVNCKNCYWTVGGYNSQDCGYIFHNDGLKDCYEVDYTSESELLYECSVAYDLYNCNFCFEVGNLKNSEYCVRCFNSHDLFGCVGRNHAAFQILNQAYAPEEYFKKVAGIKDQLFSANKYMNFLPDIMELPSSQGL